MSLQQNIKKYSVQHPSSHYIPLKDIFLYGDGFNIEGENLSKYLTDKQKWMNMCVILDRPFIDKKTLSEITKSNPYLLKEMSILDYNEIQVNLFILLIIDYFKKQGKKESLLIQVHRGSSAIPFIDLIISILKAFYTTEIFPDEENKFQVFNFTNGFKLRFASGYKPETLKHYPNYKTIFSLSLMGGLCPYFKSGTITLPSIFIPFDTKNKVIYSVFQTKTDNYLITKLDEILDVDQHLFFPVINSFKSENPSKTSTASIITPNSIAHTDVTILKLDELYDPTEAEFNDLVYIDNEIRK